MSLAMALAKQGYGAQGGAYAQGDPGLFSFVGKAIGGIAGLAGKILPGPLGTIAKGVSSILTPKPISVAKQSVMFPTIQGQPLSTGSGVKIGPGGVQVGTFPQIGTGLPSSPASTGPLVGTKGITPCATGYHYNKTTYYSKKYGVIQKGTVCVKNRRRNPLNPRALSRSMARVKSAQKAVRCLQLFAGPAARASAKGGGVRKKSGGCKGGCKR